MIQANMTSTKSDLDAKTAFCKCLENRGFTTEIRQAPADIRAEKDGVDLPGQRLFWSCYQH